MVLGLTNCSLSETLIIISINPGRPMRSLWTQQCLYTAKKSIVEDLEPQASLTLPKIYFYTFWNQTIIGLLPLFIFYEFLKLGCVASVSMIPF